MGLLLALLMLVLGWGAVRERPLVPPAYEYAWEPGTQVLPIAVPTRPAEPWPTDPKQRLVRLTQRSVSWRDDPATPDDRCQLFVRASSQHWARLPVSPSRLTTLAGRGVQLPAPGERPLVLYLPRDAFVDDDDQDGDPLDAGELTRAGPGAEVELYCDRP